MEEVHPVQSEASDLLKLQAKEEEKLLMDMHYVQHHDIQIENPEFGHKLLGLSQLEEPAHLIRKCTSPSLGRKPPLKTQWSIRYVKPFHMVETSITNKIREIAYV